MYSEDDLIPLSALQHLMFCERQCALIHIEQVWTENRWTAEGRIMHEKVHELGSESRGKIRIARGLRIRSYKLGLSGQADVVEFHRPDSQDQGLNVQVSPVDPSADSSPFADIFGLLETGNPQHSISPALHDSNVPTHPSTHTSAYTPTRPSSHPSSVCVPFPIEYKRGRPKKNSCDEVQLCAQAMCLEEMLGIEIESGAIFYGTKRRRHEVQFTSTLRTETEEAARLTHKLIRSGKTPPTTYEKKCDNCSLFDVCQPKQVARRTHSANRYLNHLLNL